MKKILVSAMATLFVAGAVFAGGAVEVQQNQAVESVQEVSGNVTAAPNNWPLRMAKETPEVSLYSKPNNWPL